MQTQNNYVFTYEIIHRTLAADMTHCVPADITHFILECAILLRILFFITHSTAVTQRYIP